MKNILIVDDDEAVLKLLEAFLVSKGGLQVSAALDGEAALQAMKKTRPDLVILDVIMPRLDGYGFLREVKKVEAWRSIPVIVLTAREMMRDVFIQEGVKDFVTKPYEPEELYRIMSKYLAA